MNEEKMIDTLLLSLYEQEIHNKLSAGEELQLLSILKMYNSRCKCCGTAVQKPQGLTREQFRLIVHFVRQNDKLRELAGNTKFTEEELWESWIGDE